MRDEVLVLPCSTLAPPLEIRTAPDTQISQRGEALYPLRQGFDARALPDREVFKGGEAAHGFRKASQPPRPSNVESVQREELVQAIREMHRSNLYGAPGGM